jgi:hypothetical protein
MNTIVVNTLTRSVSEYDWAFQSITPTHAGDAAGLYLLGGDKDGASDINAAITTGKTLWGSSLVKAVRMAYLSIIGAGTGLFRVAGNSGSWSYTFPIIPKNVSRSKPGQGIRENYLSFGFSNVAGANFQLDRIEVDIAESKTRRTS